ncbi:MAG: prephenate dehydratase domain-containing protein [Rikenellaceae bacterium]
MKRVAIQGITGCFHEQAARQYFSREQIEIVPCRSFTKLFEALKADHDKLGIMAIENTIAGALLQNHELLRESDHLIVGEYKLRIEHMIAVLPDVELEDVTEVDSHPIALMQCQKWLNEHPKVEKVVEKSDTAAAAAEIARFERRNHAAICSELAAKIYGLKILCRGVETNKRNFTRFLILAPAERAAEMVAHEKINKASIVFTLAHSSGALSKVLTILSFYDLNLTKIQSMPLIGREWEYQFYLDLSFTNYERYKQAIEAIRPLTNYIKNLGEYVSFEVTE